MMRIERGNLPKTETDTLALGLTRLTAVELQTRISGQNFYGLYRPPFDYVIRFDAGGGLWGENNYGTQDHGQWAIDRETGGLSVSWHSHWDAHTTHAYVEGDVIHQFDTDTGQWRTSMTIGKTA